MVKNKGKEETLDLNRFKIEFYIIFMYWKGEICNTSAKFNESAIYHYLLKYLLCTVYNFVHIL